MSYMRGSLIRRTEMLLKSKVIPHKPKWFDAVVKCPPLADYMPRKRPGEIKLLEDPYVVALYKRRPELKYESFEQSM
eukprot:c22310_g1_i4 orf=100-330(+)